MSWKQVDVSATIVHMYDICICNRFQQMIFIRFSLISMLDNSACTKNRLNSYKYYWSETYSQIMLSF